MLFWWSVLDILVIRSGQSGNTEDLRTGPRQDLIQTMPWWSGWVLLMVISCMAVIAVLRGVKKLLC